MHRWADLVDRAIDIFARYEPQPLEALRKDRILEFTTLLLDSIGDHPSAQALIAQLPDAIARAFALHVPSRRASKTNSFCAASN